MDPARHSVVLVVPCFNEAGRLRSEEFLGLIDADPALGLLFVDDGSRDDTPVLHARMAAARPRRIEVKTLPENRGKAEAVRQGLLHALAGPAGIVGYLDADLATPAAEVQRLLAVLRALPEIHVLLAARVKLMGRSIERRAMRHYLGRLFATAASGVLGLAVYDTQCGAKLLRATPALAHALAEPFLSRWIFDVELLGRMVTGAPGIEPLDPERVREEPLACWADISGSKLAPAHMLLAASDLARIGIDLARRRRRQRP